MPTGDDAMQRAAPEGVEREYLDCAPGLLAFLKGRLRDSALAEDILHDVFVAYCRHSKTTAIDSPRSYLYQSAHRLSLNALRQRSMDSKIQSRLSSEAAGLRTAPAGDPALAAAALEGLAALNNDEREVLMMRVYGELTFREIADVLNVPLVTVFKRYEDSTRVMRRCMGDSSTGGKRAGRNS
jgi:RNA polymerase sigma-70 factor (ECF subfamily)